MVKCFKYGKEFPFPSYDGEEYCCVDCAEINIVDYNPEIHGRIEIVIK